LLICVPNVLTKAQVAEFRQRLAAAPWEDGRATAGAQSGGVKHNSQVPQNHPEARALGDAILGELH
jgi:PKHD-type hydroxylase